MTLAAIGQACSTASISHNLAQSHTLIREAVEAGAKALFLPEAADYIASSPSESYALARPLDSSDFVRGIRHASQEHKLSICVGVHEPSDKVEGKVKNTLLWIDETGQIREKYRKLHLFDVDIKDGPTIKESNSTEKGDRVVPPFQTAIGHVGLAICFDLRFSKMASSLRRQGSNVITYPSAFAVATGEAHWHVLLRARAIETQSYVIAAAQVGKHNAHRSSYGHSMIVDPWGRIVTELGGENTGEPEIGFADIDLDLVERVRANMPLIKSDAL